PGVADDVVEHPALGQQRAHPPGAEPFEVVASRIGGVQVRTEFLAYPSYLLWRQDVLEDGVTVDSQPAEGVVCLADRCRSQGDRTRCTHLSSISHPSIHHQHTGAFRHAYRLV